MLTIEEAHIKAYLLYEEKYGCVFVQINTFPGEDPEPQYEIIVSGEYDGGDTALGSGSSWESAFEDAVKKDIENDKIKAEFELRYKHQEELRKKSAKLDKLEKRKNRKRHV